MIPSPDSSFPNHVSIAAELVMSSIDNNATSISIIYDLFHNTISVKDNSPGISKKDFYRVITQKSSCQSTHFKLRNFNRFYLLSKIANLDIQTRTADDLTSRRITIGKPQITSTLFQPGTEIIISSIFSKNPIKLSQVSDPKSKNDSLYKFKCFLNTISLNFLNIKFILNGYTINPTKCLYDRWRLITGQFLTLSSNNQTTFFTSKITFGFQFPFSHFMVNLYPASRLEIDGHEEKPIKNTIISIKAEIKEIEWEEEGLFLKISKSSTDLANSINSNSSISNLNFSSHVNIGVNFGQVFAGNEVLPKLRIIGIFQRSYIIAYLDEENKKVTHNIIKNHQELIHFNNLNPTFNKFQNLEERILKCNQILHSKGILNKPQKRVLYAIDQHAASERVNMEKLLNNVSDPFQSFELKNPMTVPFEPQKCLSHLALKKLERWGWKVRKVGEKWILYSIPAVEKYFVDDIAGMMEYAESVERGVDSEYPSCVLHAIQTRACKKSIRFGDVISNEEARALLLQLSNCKRPNYCAHGRTVFAPIMDIDNPNITYTPI